MKTSSIAVETSRSTSDSMMRKTNKVHLLSYTTMNNNHIFYYIIVIIVTWDKYSGTIPSSVIIQPLILFNAIKFFYISRHMQYSTRLFFHFATIGVLSLWFFNAPNIHLVLVPTLGWEYTCWNDFLNYKELLLNCYPTCEETHFKQLSGVFIDSICSLTTPLYIEKHTIVSFQKHLEAPSAHSEIFCLFHHIELEQKTQFRKKVSTISTLTTRPKEDKRNYLKAPKKLTQTCRKLSLLPPRCYLQLPTQQRE